MFLLPVGIGEDQVKIGVPAVGDPHLSSVQKVTVSLGSSGRFHGGGVRSHGGFAQAIGAKGELRAKRPQKTRFLLFGSKGDNGMEGQSADEDGDEDSHVTSRQLLGQQADIQHPPASTPVFLGNERGEKSFFVSLPDDVEGKRSVAVMFGGHGKNDFPGKTPSFFLNRFLFRGQIESDHLFPP